VCILQQTLQIKVNPPHLYVSSDDFGYSVYDILFTISVIWLSNLLTWRVPDESFFRSECLFEDSESDEPEDHNDVSVCFSST
jgi:hypothetical protein